MKDQAQEFLDKNTDMPSDDTEDKLSDVVWCRDTLFYNPDGQDCRSCKVFIGCSDSYLKYYVQLPFLIIDNLMSKKKMSHSAFIVFLYICRKADFRTDSNHFGRCWVSLTEISEVTGVKVSNMRKYLNELKMNGMISWHYIRKKTDDGYKTVHEFRVTHLKLLGDLKREGKELLIEWKKSHKKSKSRNSITR